MAIKTIKDIEGSLNIYIAFDQATHKTGYSIWDKDSKELLGYGLINITTGETIERINKLKVNIIDFYKSIKEKCNIEILFEDIQYQAGKEKSNTISFGVPKQEGLNNIKTFKTLAWLQGILLGWCKEEGIKTYTMFSSTWKSYCGIKGGTSAVQKQGSIDFVKKNFGLEVQSDVADAICLGWTGIHK